MSQLVLDISRLQTAKEQLPNREGGSLRCHLICQFLDVEVLAGQHTDHHVSRLVVQNVPDFTLEQTRIKLYMDEQLYLVKFVNSTKFSLQPGDAIDLTIATWGSQESNKHGSLRWEVLDIAHLTMGDIKAMREFQCSPEGIQFFH
ncbi:uncharacterized protein KNAG_0H02440 [Huiozyma naganishii CBS 8797]|uniref:Uncharacterized protein n=1 Tax=Huiozyma naganishii (strain ATCC MYA-139 / BCRC 22969 / CBS 8797 / KCTC 17520 / NBRC 10181 / NCYC 3082 / Yp74L-3) TaxID=1071383 RepID=J7S8N7_HUIN7|nr:hypothetical protein KNAG_0H02440 [Kazachstania naganishii CBS 8797]CCK71659.1 hypothetical protein KNAG_0H02440 [Kazachstania naganishii CBS 8797]